ncbi:MAG TPA: NAD(P)-dependent oxidoreductase, partial [Solirubrobacteraceae bacterium]
MKIFLAGATGAIGRHLVPDLVGRGHDVVGTTRTQAKAGALRAAGAEPVVLDILDRDTVMLAVMRAEPDVVMHQATALTGMDDLRHWERTFALTNRLRIEGTDNLLAAAQAAGASRFIAQSYAGWPNARTGGPVKTEDDPLDPDPPEEMRSSLEAIRHVESVVPAAEGLTGIVLRYGGLYGPATGLWPGGEQYE